MASTYTLISGQTLVSTAATITFSSIPATYTDLQLVASMRSDYAGAFDAFTLQFNTDTATNYSFTRLAGTGNGGTAISSRVSTSAPTIVGPITSAGANASTFASVKIDIPNYLIASDKQIRADSVSERFAQAANMEANAYLWASTAAINQIVINRQLGTVFNIGSSFYLYGIKNS
jgi:hypothetical protein